MPVIVVNETNVVFFVPFFFLMTVCAERHVNSLPYSLVFKGLVVCVCVCVCVCVLCSGQLQNSHVLFIHHTTSCSQVPHNVTLLKKNNYIAHLR